MIFPIEIVPFWIASVLCTALAVYSFKRPQIQGSTIFGYMMISATLWMMLYTFDLMSPGLDAKKFWLKVKYFGSAPAAAFWAYLCLHLTDNTRWINKWFHLVVWGWVALLLFVVWTNPWHHLFWQDIQLTSDRVESLTTHGPLFNLYAIPAGGIVPLSVLVFAAHMITAPPFYRMRAVLLLFAGVLPIAGRFLALSGFEIVPGVDQVPLMLAFASVIYAFAIFSFQALDVLRVAQGLVIDSVEVALVVVDHARKLLGLNPYARALFPTAEVQQDLDEAFPELDRRALVNGDEFEVQLFEGTSLRFFLIKVSEVANQRIGHLGHALIMVDITEQKLAERALQENMAARTHFFANVSHELRTPLHGVTGLLELLRSTELTETQKDYLEKADDSAKVLLALINDVLDLSRVESVGLSLETVPFSLDSVLQNVMSVVGVKAAEDNIEIKSHWIKMDRQLVGDPLRLTQILTNLVTNAIKFTERGFVRIEAIVVERNVSDIRLAFSVTDTGKGISEDRVESLFDPFNQGDTATFRQYGGSGLGLAICRQLVRAMGSDIKVTSVPGEGSRFSFSLRFALGETLEQTEAALLDTFPRRLSQSHVLVVDDSSINRQVAEELLLQIGCSATLVDSGRAAIAALQSEPIDLVLMDIQMPDMDGYETTREIRDKLGLQLPVIAATAGGSEEDRRRVTEAGMDDIVLKPFQGNDLYLVISKYLNAEPVLETGGGGRFLGGNEERYQKLLGELVSDVSTKISDAQAGTSDQLQKLMHEIKGSAGFLGAKELASLASDMEQQLLQGSEPEELDLHAFEVALTRLAAEVEQSA